MFLEVMKLPRESSPELVFPEWVPECIIDALARINAKAKNEENPQWATEVLRRLATNSRMKHVWQEVFRRKLAKGARPGNFFNPVMTQTDRAARLRRQAKGLLVGDSVEDRHFGERLSNEASDLEKTPSLFAHPEWNLQERAAQCWIYNAYEIALADNPVYLSDLKEQKAVLQTTSETLQSLVIKLQPFVASGYSILTQHLRELAEEAKREAQTINPENYPKIEDPWVLVRKREHDRLRTFVINFSFITFSIFGRRMHGTVANVASAIYGNANLSGDQVRTVDRQLTRDLQKNESTSANRRGRKSV